MGERWDWPTEYLADEEGVNIDVDVFDGDMVRLVMFTLTEDDAKGAYLTPSEARQVAVALIEASMYASAKPLNVSV